MTVEFFDNADDMFSAIRRGVEQAKIRATPEQNAITYGDYWMRLWEDLLIFGYIFTKEEMRQSEKDAGATDEEIDYEEKMMTASYNDGFRFGRAYSVVEPNGELGDTHVSDMIKITKEEFESAKSLRWLLDDITKTDWFPKYLVGLIGSFRVRGEF